MIPSAFEYLAPTSVEQAIEHLQQHGDEAKVLAGGHSLIPLMKLRLATPAVLVDLRKIPDLAYIRDAGDHVAIGAMTRHYSVETSELLKGRLPLLSQAAGIIGDMQVRNRGTIGGSLAHADPASDMPSVVTALGGTIVVRGPQGQRELSADDFFQHIWTSALQTTEVLTEIRIPYRPGDSGQYYEKFRQRAADWAIVGAAVCVDRTNGSLNRASIVLTNVGTTPVRATAVEQALAGQAADADAIRRAADFAAEGLDPSGELRASPEYKKHLARVITRRALEAALGVH